MPTIEILGTGRIDERDSAFPQAVQLPGGDLLCSFSVGGGALVTGGTEWARSRDGGGLIPLTVLKENLESPERLRCRITSTIIFLPWDYC